MTMTDKQIQNLLLSLHRPIPWDPVPFWIKLDPERMRQFNEVQAELNTKMADLQARKIQQLAEITGISSGRG